MTANNGNALTLPSLPDGLSSEWLKEMEEKITLYRDGLLVQEAGLTEQYNALRGGIQKELTKANRMLGALSDEPKKKPKRVNTPRRVGITFSNGTPTGFGVTLETVAEGADAIKGMVTVKRASGEPETFTQQDVYVPLGWDQGKSSSAFRAMRHYGFLRKAGREGRGELWAVMDEDAIAQEVKRVEIASKSWRDNLASPSEKSEDPLERIAAYIRAHERVEGLTAIVQDLSLPGHRVDSAREVLEDAGLITATRVKGKKTVLTWKGDN